MTHAIDVQSIVKRFGDFTAVDGISFTVEPGEIFGLLGSQRRGQVDSHSHDDDAHPADRGDGARRRAPTCAAIPTRAAGASASSRRR